MNNIQIPLRDLGVVRFTSVPQHEVGPPDLAQAMDHAARGGSPPYIAEITLKDGSVFVATGDDCVDAMERVCNRLVEEVGS